MEKIVKTTKLDFTTLKFHENYVISVVKEGEVLTKNQLGQLIGCCEQFYKNNPFVFISKRINFYNVDPTVYMKLEKVKKLKGIAIASGELSALNMANFEKNFSKIPFEIFHKLEDAKQWALNKTKK